MNNHVHSLNVSPAHQKYSFGKGIRFIYDKPRYSRNNKELMYTMVLKVKEIAVQQLLGMGRDLWICKASLMLIRLTHIQFLRVSTKTEVTLLRQVDM